MLLKSLLKLSPLFSMGLLLNSAAPAYAVQQSTQQYHGAPISAKTKAAFIQITKDLEERARSGMANPQIQNVVRGAVERGAETMANPDMEADRKKVLKFLGINPNGNSAIYILISWSMPLPMIRAYAIEALWTGGELALKGLPPGVSLKTFLLKDLRQLVYNKGAGSVIAIDPRLFDTYKVTVAPTIVLTTDTKNFMCANAGKGTVIVDKKHYSFNYCPPMNRNKYWKIEGAVTLGYALRAFRAAGAPPKVVNMYLNALKKGYAKGAVPSRAQAPYKGSWKSAPVPGTPDKAYENLQDK